MKNYMSMILWNINTSEIWEQTVNVTVKLWDKEKKFDIKVNIVENLTNHTAQQALDKTPLTIWDDKYQVLNNSAAISNNAGIKGAVFYTTKKFEGNDPTEWNKWETANTPEDGTCYMIIGQDRYKVNIDQFWDLCPIATKFDNKLNFKDWSDASEQVFLSNNQSCMRYLHNKLPDEIKRDCKIWRNNIRQDYTLTSYGRTLSIEPRTIAWDWISNDLWKNLAFINLTNYLRDLWDKRGKKDPDINSDLKIRWIRMNGKNVTIDKNTIWLGNATSDELAKFKRYNNREKWVDNEKWDRKRENKIYRRI